MKTSEKMIERLRKAGVKLPIGVTLTRTYCGSNQLSTGAWSWYIKTIEGKQLNIGSPFPASELLKQKAFAIQYLINAGDWEVLPDPKLTTDTIFGYNDKILAEANPR